jgi:hypothetical protein
MARSRADSWRRLLGAAGALGVAWAAAGCGGGIDVVPVSGRVTVDGEPLRAKSGNVAFVPDAAKGNTTTRVPTGYLDENGHYTLYYAQGKKGAPPGWYKVQVAAAAEGEKVQMPRLKGHGPRPPPPLFHSKFTRVKTSGLEVEVVRDPAPGAYDLKLTR